jgi:acyl transferase domain-containing protein
LSYFRGQAVKELATERGGMAAVGMSAEDVRKYLRKGVTMACENSPASVTLSGDEDTLLPVLEDILSKRQDTFCKQLKVSTAYHSGTLSNVVLRGWILTSCQRPCSNLEVYMNASLRRLCLTVAE